MMPLLPKKAINSVLTLNFCRVSFLAVGKSVNTRSPLPWWCFPEAMNPGHIWKWSLQKFPYASVFFVYELVRHKSGDLPLTQIIADDSVRRVLANAQFLRNQSQRQSPILCQHLSHFIDHFWGSACRWPTRTWLILSRFLPLIFCCYIILDDPTDLVQSYLSVWFNAFW